MKYYQFPTPTEYEHIHFYGLNVKWYELSKNL